VLLDGYLSACRPLPLAVAERVQDIDPGRYPGSEWQSMIEYDSSIAVDPRSR
jgi:hypothetical protein